MKELCALLAMIAAFLNLACSERTVDAPLHDRVIAAAQDLRWTKRAEGRATVPLARFGRPVLVLALPPGKYTSADLDPLVRNSDGKRWLRRWIREQALQPDTPTIYVSQPGRGIDAALYHDHISIPRALALWKEDNGPLDVSLRRESDDVQIVAVR
jgi:hypothetical protein